jgi:hypothetical protein
MNRARALQIAALILITFTAFSSAYAQKKKEAQQPQEQCAVAQAPAMRGFRLGMLLPEVKGALEDASLFDSKISGTNNVGSRAVRLQGSELKGDNAEGVDDVDLVFVDERLTYIKVNFNGAMRWDNAEDFFARMSETLGLPKPSLDDRGRGSNQRNQKYTFECRTFSVTFSYSFGVTPSVAISNTAAQRLVGTRRENSDEGDIKSISITPRSGTGQPQPRPRDPQPTDNPLPPE